MDNIAKHIEARQLDTVAEHPHNCLRALPHPETYTRAEAIDLIVRGGFPEIRKLNAPDRMDRYMSYLDSIVERDVAPIMAVREPDALRRLIDQLAARTAEELSVAALCTALGIRKETVNTYFDILSRLGAVHRLGAWTSSGGRREIRAPKLHFLDAGCATALRGEDRDSFGLRANPVALGHLLETLIFVELEKSLRYAESRRRLYHWRQDARTTRHHG